MAFTSCESYIHSVLSMSWVCFNTHSRLEGYNEICLTCLFLRVSYDFIPWWWWLWCWSSSSSCCYRCLSVVEVGVVVVDVVVVDAVVVGVVVVDGDAVADAVDIAFVVAVAAAAIVVVVAVKLPNMRVSTLARSD